MRRNQFVTFVSIPALLLLSTPSMSQATPEQFLSTVTVDKNGKCSTIDVRLNRPASYLHHFPATAGDLLSITVEPLGTTTGDATEVAGREAASVPVGNSAGLDNVSFDPSASGGAEIRLSFVKSVAYRVIMDTNTRHLHVDVSSPTNALMCLGRAEGEIGEAPTQDAKSDGPLVGSSPEAALAEGKSQLAGKDYARATAYFTKAASTGSGKTKQEAQEFLGLARERAGQLPHAQAEYQTYLKSWPKGPGATRVRGRLEGVRAAMEQAAEQQFAERRSAKTSLNPEKKVTPELKPSQVDQVVSDQTSKGEPDVADGPVVLGGLRSTGTGMVLKSSEPVKDPNDWTWDHSGSLAQIYYRNDNFRSSDPASHNYGLHEVFQNEIISTADGFLRGQNQDYEIELRSSLFNERGFGQQADVKATSIGTLYADMKSKQTGLSARVGRQSKSTGGVFGRYDGALIGWQLDKQIKLQAYSGSPVYRRDAKPFADKRIFYGTSVDYTFPGDQWAGALYAMAQDIGTIIDRRALGAELRYTGKSLSVYTAGDYDLFFNEVNNAYVSANWHVRDGTNVYANADFRRVPFLLTENALMGQSEDDLESLVGVFGEETVYQLALDRTASAKTLSGGMSQEINENWQVNFDGTLAEYSGTPASGGVDAIPPPGMEYYVSSQLNGQNVFKTADSITMGLRYSGSKTSNFYMADVYYRFPVNENWRINPRLRVSLRDSKTNDQKQLLVMPSVASRYRLSKNWSFDSEIGFRWEDVMTSLGDTRTLDMLATAGYRFEF
jgi:hypothetical protein